MDTTLNFSSTLRQIETRYRDAPLMQRAGAAAADWAAILAVDRNRPILILAGPGNNGGDAFETARLLRERFFDVHLVFSGDPRKLPADAADACQHFVDAGGQYLTSIPDEPAWALIIDGIFGIGLTRAPDGFYFEWISTANSLSRRDNCPLLALDCPSGLNADTGTAPGNTIRATHTITFISGKPGLLTAEGPDHCGEIRVVGLDLPADALTHADASRLLRAEFAGQIKPRRQNSHKGNFGTAGILGGAPSMVGAAFLAGRSTIRLGSGKVYVGLLEQAAPSIDLLQPELMLRKPRALLQTPLDALAVGPGLGVSLEASELLESAIALDLPLLLDADALNLVGSESNLQQALAGRSQPAILTPHPSEAARLLDCSTAEIQDDRIAAARKIARRYRCHVALKGCGTIVTRADGKFWINSTGNPGMATAGMGDVLTGLILALLAQGWPAIAALQAGVHLHGAAADRLLAQGIGPIGLTAGETIDAARQVFNEWAGTGTGY